MDDMLPHNPGAVADSTGKLNAVNLVCAAVCQFARLGHPHEQCQAKIQELEKRLEQIASSVAFQNSARTSVIERNEAIDLIIQGERLLEILRKVENDNRMTAWLINKFFETAKPPTSDYAFVYLNNLASTIVHKFEAFGGIQTRRGYGSQPEQPNNHGDRLENVVLNECYGGIGSFLAKMWLFNTHFEDGSMKLKRKIDISGSLATIFTIISPSIDRTKAIYDGRIRPREQGHSSDDEVFELYLALSLLHKGAALEAKVCTSDLLSRYTHQLMRRGPAKAIGGYEFASRLGSMVKAKDKKAHLRSK